MPVATGPLPRLARAARRREPQLLAALLAAGIALRLALVAYSPQPYGYVWDFYHEGVRWLYAHGTLPGSTDCWQCYHPPLFYLVSWPVYAAQRTLSPGTDDGYALRAVAALSLVWTAVTIFFGWRLLRLFRCRGASMVIGASLLILFPCLFISSYSAEADVLLTAIGSALAYYLTRYFINVHSATGLDAVRLGVLTGLAIATKYSGLGLAAATILVICLGLVSRPRRLRAARDLGIVIVVCAVLGGWKYVDNARRYGTPLFANGEAAQGFSLAGRRSFLAQYEFTTLRLRDAVALFPPDAPTGRLTRFPVYNSVFTTLHALAWSDMSFFSVPGRHGDRSRPYPTKHVSRGIVRAVLTLGLVPEALAVLGFIVALRHRSLWPVAILCTVMAASYAWWFPSQALWGLKTKYILVLLPPGALYAVAGLGWLARRAPPLALGAGCALAALIIVTPIYLYQFAIGSL